MKMNILLLRMKQFNFGKLFKPFAWLFAATAVFVACEINNPVADLSDPGYIAANVYWDVPVANVKAGNNVEFYAEYWSVDGEINYLGVWYDIQKTQKYILTNPVTGYSFSLDSSELSRELLEIKTFTHSEDNYVPEKKAYVIQDQFPVSYTLASLEYKNPITFNADQFNQLIPGYVKEQFLNNLFPQLAYPELKTLLVTDRQIVEPQIFESYFDSISTGDVVSRIMKTEAGETLRSDLNDVPFSALIYNKNRQYYAVEFTQGYQLDARFRVVNGNGVENFSDTKQITVF